MKRFLLFSLLTSVLLSTVISASVSFRPVITAATENEVVVFRYWNDINKKHVMSADFDEMALIQKTPQWKSEGGVFKAYKYIIGSKTCSEGSPVYRFISKSNSYFYAFQSERDILISNPNWILEGVVFCAKSTSYSGTDGVKAYRFFNPKTESHVFTSNAGERNQINMDPSWKFEGEAFSVIAYANPLPKPTPVPSPQPTPIPAPTPIPDPSPFGCNCKKTCTQIMTCQEAYYQLNTCGCNERDGDNDGVPCENLCG
jgi:hypothetical protein